MTMLDAVSGRGTLSLFDGTHETDIVGIGDGRLSLGAEIARRTGRFLLIWQRGADRVEMPITGSVWDDGRSVAVETSDASPLLASLAQGGTDAETALIGAALAAPVEVPREHRSTRLLLKLAVGVASAALFAYNAVQLYHAAVTITPQMAYLATEVSTITAPASGKLTFAAGPGSIAKGEPILGIENARGKTILVDATEDVRIVVQDKQVGDRVKGGEPLLAVADSHPPTYIVAIMSREQAFRLSTGAYAHYSFLHDAPGAARSVFIAGDAFELSLLPAQSGADAQLYRVRFRIPDEALARAEPIVLDLQQALADRAATLLNGMGVPPDQVARVHDGLQWLETALRTSTGASA